MIFPRPTPTVCNYIIKETPTGLSRVNFAKLLKANEFEITLQRPFVNFFVSLFYQSSRQLTASLNSAIKTIDESVAFSQSQ